MNKKLEDYRDGMFKETLADEHFLFGFDVAIELNLAVKFAEWLSELESGIGEWDEEYGNYRTSYKYENEEFTSEKKTFDYWVDNILNLEE